MTIRYVSGTGSDTADGLSVDSPLKTVEHAKSVSAELDAICLMDGVEMDPVAGRKLTPPTAFSGVGDYPVIQLHHRGGWGPFTKTAGGLN